MLKQVKAPKTSALNNLEEMFADYPVVTSESSILKLDVIGEMQESDRDDELLNFNQQLFSQLMTSVNPFSQFIVIELVQGREPEPSQHWCVDEKIIQRPQNSDDEVTKLFSSSEMFSIYNYSKDPMMLVKSERYTGNEWKKVVDLVNLDENLLVSSQISNALLSI